MRSLMPSFMRLKQRSNVDFPQPEGPMNEGDLLVADLDIHVLERMVVAIEQVEALDIDTRRRGGKTLPWASRIPQPRARARPRPALS